MKNKNEIQQKELSAYGAELYIVTLPNDILLKMVKVEPGRFRMGSKFGGSEEKTHKVSLTKLYYLGETEVTQAQWEAVMGYNPSCFNGMDRPVERVSWDEAMEFCRLLNESEISPESWMFTLPTEAQWEFAARGGNKRKGRIYSGSDCIDNVGWFYENSGRKRLGEFTWSMDKLESNSCQTHIVKQKSANELGLYDMSGNVWEWCLDWYGPCGSCTTADPTGPLSGSYRVLRGGSWRNNANCCRVTSRNIRTPDIRNNDLGFRLALVPVQ